MLKTSTTLEPARGEERYVPPRRGDEISDLVLLGYLLVSPFWLAWQIVKHWPITLPAALALYGWYTLGTPGVIIVTAAVLVIAVVWRMVYPSSFHRAVMVPFGRRRRKRLYRSSWVETMHNAGLSRGYGAARVAPRIVKIKFDAYTDRLLVQMLAGQGIDELRTHTDALRDTFGVLRCDVIPAPGGRKAGRVWVTLTRIDRLEEVVAPIPATDPVDLSCLTVGLREDGAPWTVSLAGGMHLLIGGVTGAGKSSLVWSIINALGPAIRDGLVQVWAADPKGGMELAKGQDLFARFAHRPRDMVQLVLDAEQLIEHRAAKYRGNVRTHVPTIDEPHIVLILDELVMLTTYAPNAEAKKQINRALPRVLSQGRALGITDIGAVQDPRKSAVDFRGLFPNRAALRMSEADDVGMILTDGAHTRGAECEHISPKLKGLGYVETPDDDTPVRVRASYFDDDALHQLVTKYAPRPRPDLDNGHVIEGHIIDDEGAAGMVAA